ncbi:hypothetical protein Tco_1171844, partial [Tanacetum coccineum]
MDNVRPRTSYLPIKRSYYTRAVVRPKDLKQDVKTSGVKNMTTAGTRAVVNTGKGKMDNDLKKSRWVWRPKGNYMDHESKEKGYFILKKFEAIQKVLLLNFSYLIDSRDSFEGTNRNEADQVQTPHDSPLSGGHTSDRAKGALNLQELSVLCTNLSNRVLALESIKDAQAAKISALKIRIKKLEKKCKQSISHHKAWLKSVQRLSMKKRFGKKESVSKQGRKKSKPESTLDDSTIFNDQDADHGVEYMKTEEAVDERRQSGETEEVKLTDDTEVVEDKGSGDKRGNAEELVSTARPEVSTARPDIDAARQEDS